MGEIWARYGRDMGEIYQHVGGVQLVAKLVDVDLG